METLGFYDWLQDSRRSLDELFFAELLIEAAEDKYPRRAPENFSDKFEKRRAQLRQRFLDPAYRPKISRKRAEVAAPYLSELKYFSPSLSYDDRHVADVSALRYCPSITSLNLHSRLRDLSGMLALPALESLTLFDKEVRDLSALRDLPHLRHLHLYLHHPWPEPAGLDALNAPSISLHMNLLILEGIPAWPRAERVSLTTSHIPLRDLRKLPALPVVKHLQVSTATLDGIERYPTVEHLDLQGVFEDLSPLAGLPALTELTLRGERFEDLTPLSGLPSLRRLKLERERGLILDPLLEAPRLKKVEAPHCRVITTELASLNTAIGWQPEDFSFDTPKPQPPLRLLCYDPKNPETDVLKKTPAPPDGREFASGDETFSEAESAWLVARLQKCLDSHLSPGWGGVRTFISGSPYVAFFRDIERRAAWSILELMRSALADARYPWDLQVCFDENEEDEWQESPSNFDEDGLYIESPEEKEEDRQRARDQRAHLEREHLLRLGAQGLPVPPSQSDLPPPEPPPEPEPPEDEATSETYYPPTELRLTLTEEFAWITAAWREAAEVILERQPEDWHALPEPPEKRPRPA